MQVQPESRAFHRGQPPGAIKVASAEKVGASIFIDSFESSDSHGYFVEGAAQSLGSLGPTQRLHQHQKIDGRVAMPHSIALSTLQFELASQSLSGDVSKEHLETFVTDAAAGNLQWASGLLSQVSGFQNSVVNLSQGLDAIVLLHMANLPLSAKSKLSSEAQETYGANLRSALKLDPASPQIVVDKALLSLIKTALASSPQVGQAVEGWRQQVRTFEADRNSVVLSAGNSGTAIKGLARAGFDIDGSEDLNVLAVPEVTTVGATTTGSQGGLSLSGTSSFGPEIDVLADGNHQERFGTSYASPKVANALRATHLLHPEFSSDQAEQWLKTQLAESGQIAGHTVAILDSGRAAALLEASVAGTQNL